MQETASLSRIRPGKNPREFFDEAEMNELAESIRSYGVLQPILVRPAGDAGPISRNRNPANGEVEAPSPSCVDPTGVVKEANKRIERKPKARITTRVLSIAFPPDKNWIVDESTEG